MLENASRQLFLVLLTIAAGIACCLLFDIPLGHDLKGGTQLRYELPPDVLQQLVQKEGAPIDVIIEQTIAVIAERIDPTGTLDPLITRSGDTGILIELPFFEDPLELKRVRERVNNLGKLEMRMVADQDYVKDLVRFNMKAEQQRLQAWLQNPENKKRVTEDPREIKIFNNDQVTGPIAFANLAWYPRLIRPTADGVAWDRPFSMMSQPQLSGGTVKGYEDADFANGVVPEAMLKLPVEKRHLVEFVAINMLEQSFSGEDLDPSGVSAGPSGKGGLGVHYSIIGARSSEYANWSERHIGKPSAIILNGYIKSAPTFESKIPGNGIITGDFTTAEVEELVKVLRTGSLRVEPQLVSSESIGPTLGRQAVERGAFSLIAGAVLVFLFMLWYYGAAGTIACVTLVLNVFLLWAAMLFMQATITLPGLGGIVLTMGMAVDANVLIYERIREEMAKGKDMLRSVRAGFERAMSAILDSNITTFLVGMVLFNVGVGPVRGFAVTLMVGIVTTVFTQFFVTRLLFHFALEKGKLDNYKPRSLFASLNLDYVASMKPCIAISAVVIGVGLAYTMFVAPREVTLGIDFTGGANMQMVVAQPASADAVRDRLQKDAVFSRDYPNAAVNTIGDSKEELAKQFNIRLKLNDGQRTAIEAGRKDHAQLRRTAEQAGAEPPAAYEPPYVAELRRIFKDDLVQQAFSGAIDAPLADGQNQNLQFAQVDVHFTEPVSVAAARELMSKKLARCVVTPMADVAATEAKSLRVEWTTQKATKPWQFANEVQEAIAGLADAKGKKILLSDPFPVAQEIQGRLVSDLRNAAIGALILAWALIVLYLRVRFHEYKYGIAAVVALIHDVLVALVMVVICNHLGLVQAEINLAMIACFLTIIGYSVNDTIVIFDRIRENTHENARLGVYEPAKVLINRALNQTMSRTLLTSGLTLLVVLAQFLVNWGSDSDLESFAFAMIIGMVSGVYSTIYIAAPILIWLDKGDTGSTTTPAAAPVAANTNAS